METVGERVRAVRLARKLSQEALARTAGLSTYEITKLERGEIRQILPETARKLASPLGVSAAWLLFGDDGAHVPSSGQEQQD